MHGRIGSATESAAADPALEDVPRVNLLVKPPTQSHLHAKQSETGKESMAGNFDPLHIVYVIMEELQ